MDGRTRPLGLCCPGPAACEPSGRGHHPHPRPRPGVASSFPRAAPRHRPTPPGRARTTRPHVRPPVCETGAGRCAFGSSLPVARRGSLQSGEMSSRHPPRTDDGGRRSLTPPPLARLRRRRLCGATLKHCHDFVKVGHFVGSMCPTMRDYLDAIRSRVVVFDGGMGATLEQFDLTAEDYGGLQGKCHEALILHRPGRHRGRPPLDGRIGRRGRRDRHVPGQPAQARRVGSRATTRSRSTARRPRSRARPSARSASSRARSARPATCPPRTTRPSAGSRSASSSRSSPSRPQGLLEGGADLLIIETAQDILEVKASIFGAREAFKRVGRTRADPGERLAPAPGRQDAPRHRHRERARRRSRRSTSTPSA